MKRQRWTGPVEPDPDGITAKLCFLVSLLILLGLFLAGMVRAQDRTPATRRLTELVAKVSYNEAGDSYPDLALIWQITEARGTTDAERAYWLERHSPCVSGLLPEERARLRPGRCGWTRYLLPTGRLPRGWPGSQADWHRERPRWLAHVVRVRAFVSGEDTYRPCSGPVESWDGDVPSWRERAASRGWVPAECAPGSRNVGYRRAEPGAS